MNDDALRDLADGLGESLDILRENGTRFIKVSCSFDEAYQILQSSGYQDYLTDEVQLNINHLNWGQQLQDLDMDLVWVGDTWHSYSTAVLLHYDPSQARATMARRVL